MAFNKKNWTKEVSCKTCGEKRFVRKDSFPEYCKPCSVFQTAQKLKGQTWAKTKKCFGCNDTIPKRVPHNYCSTECKMKHKRIERTCKKCSSVFFVRKSALSGKTNASGNFCSRNCYNNYLCKDEKVTGRGSRWKQIRLETIKKSPFCAVCGTNKNLQVHHIIPYRITKNNDQENLIPLCTRHHKNIEMMFLETEKYPIEDNELFWKNVLRTSQQTTRCVLKEIYGKNRKLASG